MSIGGNLSWRQSIKVHFDEDRLVTETASLLAVRSQDVVDTYLPGNAHIFHADVNAENIVSEVKGLFDGDLITIGVYGEGSDRIYFHRENNQILVFPSATTFKDIEEFQLFLKYSVVTNLFPGRQEFSIPWTTKIYLSEYVRNLCCKEGMAYDTLNNLHVILTPPEDCIWSSSSDEIKEQLRPIKGLRLCEEQLEVRGDQIRINWEIGAKHPGSQLIRLELKAARSAENANAGISRLRQDFEQRPTEEVIVFVCDLRGSSDRTVEGRAPDDLLQFRKIWIENIPECFRQVKIIGDMAMVVASPDVFLEKGFEDILRRYENTVNLGLKVRGGFHIDRAEVAGQSSNSPKMGYHFGEEFLGDAINRGAKIGDLKENEEGILASSEFLAWIDGSEPNTVGSFWEKRKFGQWETDLYQLDLRLLQNKAALTRQDSRPLPHFADWIISRAKDLPSRLIVGLDPNIDKFPQPLQDAFQQGSVDRMLEKIIYEFNKVIIDAVATQAVAFKPQAAFYEQYGDPGLKALTKTIAYLKSKNVPIILDAKRNDIKHTAKAYADAWLSQTRLIDGTLNPWCVDAITVNAYLGKDGIKPFLDVNDFSGLFALAKTSNPSSGDIQDLLLEGGETLYERVAQLVEEWGKDTIRESGYSRIGMVVGATYPEVCEKLREIAPSALFLMPGVGAQKGPIDSIVKASGPDGLGAYAASSRSVLYEFDKEKASEDWKAAVAVAALTEAKRINQAILDQINAD